MLKREKAEILLNSIDFTNFSCYTEIVKITPRFTILRERCDMKKLMILLLACVLSISVIGCADDTPSASKLWGKTYVHTKGENSEYVGNELHISLYKDGTWAGSIPTSSLGVPVDDRNWTLQGNLLTLREKNHGDDGEYVYRFEVEIDCLVYVGEASDELAYKMLEYGDRFTLLFET